MTGIDDATVETMVSAGLRPRTIAVPLGRRPDRVAATLARHLSAEELAEVLRLLSDPTASDGQRLTPVGAGVIVRSSRSRESRHGSQFREGLQDRHPSRSPTLVARKVLRFPPERLGRAAMPVNRTQIVTLSDPAGERWREAQAYRFLRYCRDRGVNPRDCSDLDLTPICDADGQIVPEDVDLIATQMAHRLSESTTRGLTR